MRKLLWTLLDPVKRQLKDTIVSDGESLLTMEVNYTALQPPGEHSGAQISMRHWHPKHSLSCTAT